MSQVFLSCIMRTLFLLNWYLGLYQGFLMPSRFQSCWLQPLVFKVRDIVPIIICTLEGLKVINYDQTGGSWSSTAFTVSKYSSNTKLNWGLVLPVCRFLTRPTVLACRGDSPKYLSLLDLDIHLGNLLPSWILGSRTYAGNSHGW